MATLVNDAVVVERLGLVVGRRWLTAVEEKELRRVMAGGCSRGDVTQ